MRRTLTARALLTLPPSHTLVASIWNWVYSAKTGSECDMTIDQSVSLATPLWVVGNLCLRNTARVVKGPLVVEGRTTLMEPQNAVGSEVDPINQVYVGRGCQYRKTANAPVYDPCVYNTSETNIWRTAAYPFDPAAPLRIPPVEWDEWYRLASPGPLAPCATATGTPPVLDIRDADGVFRRNNNVPGVVHLTSASSYTCQTRRGELSWNASTRVLTVRGTVYIDGSARIENGLINTYDAFSSIYLSGTLLPRTRACAPS